MHMFGEFGMFRLMSRLVTQIMYRLTSLEPFDVSSYRVHSVTMWLIDANLIIPRDYLMP